MYQIINKQYLNDNVLRLDIKAPLIAKAVKPGQFVIVQVDEFGERIPLTIADFDKDNGIVSVIVQIVGLTTKKLAKLKVNDFLLVIVGPLGEPTHFNNAKKILVIGGGVGSAIAYPSAKYLALQDLSVDLVCGYRNKDIVILEDEMKKIANELIICTDDGSNGNKGYVTEYAEKLLSKNNYDLVICIGPILMMKAVSEITKKYNVKTIVSLNSIMIDGTGMCGGCRVNIDGKVKFACVDGPDFDGHLVDFDNLNQRSKTFNTCENDKCRLYEGGKNNV